MNRFFRINAQGRTSSEYVVNLEQVTSYDVRTHEHSFISGKTLNVAKNSHDKLIKALGFPSFPVSTRNGNQVVSPVGDWPEWNGKPPRTFEEYKDATYVPTRSSRLPRV